MEHFKLIHDEVELRNFFEMILPPLNPLEVYFFSLSARNKYLTDEEKVKLQLGRTEMFERRVLRERNWEKFLRLIRKFECNPEAYTTKNNSTIPAKAIVCYANINPSNMLKAYRDYQTVMVDYMYELSHCITDSRKTEDICSRFTRTDRLLMDNIQKARGVKTWIDIDFDIPHAEYNSLADALLADFLREMINRGIFYHVIETKSGYHVLLKRDTVKYNFHETIDIYSNRAKAEFAKSEIVFNNNEMIPIPGTLQGGFPVRIMV